MASHLENQIKDWRDRGVISAEVATALHDDLGSADIAGAKSRAKSFSFFRIVAVLAAVSFAAAILMFISANWAAIPRLAKVSGIMIIIAAGLVGGAVAGGRPGRADRRLEEAFYLVAGAAYVGGVALVGQLYHLPGDLGRAMFGFALGLGAAGLLVRSHVLSFAALGAIAWWHAARPLAENLLSAEFVVFAAFCAAGWGVARRLGARWIARAAIAAFIVGLIPFLIEVIDAVVGAYQALPDALRLISWLALWAASIAALTAARFRPVLIDELPGLRRAPIAIALGVGLAAVIALHLESEGLLPLLVVGPMTLIYALFVLFAFGARSAPIRWVGYVLFIGEILVLYGATVATLLGTAGLFLVVGLTLTVLAVVIYVFERRFRRPVEGGADG